MFTLEDLSKAKRRKDLIDLAQRKKIKMRRVLRNLRYEEELRLLQAELVNFQQWVAKKKMRVAILFEGRDAAGKGGTIKRFTEHLNPRSMRIVALTKPTEVERGQWYFRRYIKELPNPGRNRVLSTVAGTTVRWWNRSWDSVPRSSTRKYMVQVPEFEHMLYEDGIHHHQILVFYFEG